MDIIMGMTEKREAIKKAVQKCFQSGYGVNPHSGRTTTNYTIENVIEVDDINDMGFRGLSSEHKAVYEQLYNEHRAYIKDSMLPSQERAERLSSLGDTYKNVYKKETKELAQKSSLFANLIFYIDDNFLPACSIKLYFYNHSHNRDFSNALVWIICKDGQKFKYVGDCFSTDEHEQSYGGERRDDVILSIPFQDAEKAIVNGSEIDFSFDEVVIRGHLVLPCSCPASLVGVAIKGKSLADEQVQVVYNTFKEEIETILASKSIKEQYEDNKKLRNDIDVLKTLYAKENAVSCISQDNYSFLEDLINGKSELEEYCKLNNLRSPIVNYIQNTLRQYDTKAILADVQRLQKLAARQQRLYKKRYWRFLALFMALNGIVGAIGGGDKETIIFSIAFAFVMMALYMYILINIRRKGRFGKETERFIESYNKMALDCMRETDKRIKQMEEEYYRRSRELRWL